MKLFYFSKSFDKLKTNLNLIQIQNSKVSNRKEKSNSIQQHKREYASAWNATNIIIYLNRKFLRFLFIMKNRVLQTYPLKMNLVPEIRMDQKRSLETLPSTLLQPLS
jgi:hypothetical protein